MTSKEKEIRNKIIDNLAYTILGFNAVVDDKINEYVENNVDNCFTPSSWLLLTSKNEILVKTTYLNNNKFVESGILTNKFFYYKLDYNNTNVMLKFNVANGLMSNFTIKEWSILKNNYKTIIRKVGRPRRQTSDKYYIKMDSLNR